MIELLLLILAGIVAGILALFVYVRTIPTVRSDIVLAMIVGLIGGLVGGYLFSLLGLEAVNWLGSLVIAFLGALVILALMKRASGPTS